MKQANTPQQPHTRRFSAARFCWQLAVALVLLGTAACTPSHVQPPPESPSASAGEGQISAPAASASAAGEPAETPATAKLKQTIEDALRTLVAGSPKPSRDQITAAFVDAGIPLESFEVSASRTPTGLDVDAIEGAALQGRDCVIGQIRDGDVTVIVLPVLASGKCFAGSLG